MLVGKGDEGGLTVVTLVAEPVQILLKLVEGLVVELELAHSRNVRALARGQDPLPITPQALLPEVGVADPEERRRLPLLFGHLLRLGHFGLDDGVFLVDLRDLQNSEK